MLGCAELQAQDLTNCKKTCKKTRIVKTGPIIGLRTLTLPDSLYVKVVEVVRNGASYKNGILLGDTITHFNGKVIQNMNYFIAEVAKLQPDDTVHLIVKRKGTVSEYTFPLGALSTKKVTEIVCCDDELEPEATPETEPVTQNEPTRKPKREVEPIQPVGPDVEPETETEALTKNEPKPKRKAKREAEPIQAVGPDVEPETETEPFRNTAPIPEPKPKQEPEPIPQAEAQQLAELEQNNIIFVLSINAANEYLRVSTNEEINTEVTLDIQDPNGNVLLSEKVNKKKGNFEANINISKIPNGTYFVKIYVENTKYIQRFVKGE
jgi:hypothetical protein